MRAKRFSAVVFGLTWVVAAAAVADPVTYDKLFVFGNSAANAAAAAQQPIRGGASVNTYFSKQQGVANVPVGVRMGPRAVIGNVQIPFGFTSPTQQEPGTSITYGGNAYPYQPFIPQFQKLSRVEPGNAAAVNLATGWAPADAKYTDNLNAKDSASAHVEVSGWAAGPVMRPDKKGNMVAFNNYNTATIKGDASANPPNNDGTVAHYALSSAAVQLPGTVFVSQAGQAGPFVPLGMKGTVRAVGGQGAPGQGGVIDPIYMFVVDDTLSTTDNPVVTAAEKIMESDALYVGRAGVVVDDTGITLTRDLSDPTSSASLSFATTSSWVSDPYSYSASLTSSGFTKSGLFATSPWSVTTNDGIVTAALSWSSVYGTSGQPFDTFLVRADASAFPTDGHTYHYEMGSFDLAYQVAVPEPPTLLMLAAGLAVGLTGALRRRKGRGARSEPGPVPDAG